MLSSQIMRGADALPGFDINFRRVTSAVLRTSFWRIAEHFDLIDAWQDAFIIYLRLQQRYPDYDKKRMIATYRTSLRNHMHDLSKRCSWGFGTPLSQFSGAWDGPDRTESMLERGPGFGSHLVVDENTGRVKRVVTDEMPDGSSVVATIDRVSAAIKEVVAGKKVKLAR